MGGGFLPFPEAILKSLNLQVGDEVSIELVTNRKGEVTHLVVEKV